MEIEKVALKDLRKYKNNAKQHPQSQIDSIIESIKNFGFNDPIAIDENNMIIEGHGRFEALKQMGKKYAPCIRLTGLSKEQKKAYILAHNKLNMDTGFDMDVLKKELRAISDMDINIDFLDFDAEALIDELDVNDEDFIQGNEIVKSKFIIKIKCDSEEQMKKRERKLKKVGWI